MTFESDTHFMSLALDLAKKGHGLTSPNPMVGAVVVRDGSVVGQGFHQQSGCAHAEVVALEDAGVNTRNATLYVTLEPCNHHGKTPPCTEAIIAYGIKRVVAATLDVNPKVTGGGLKYLAEQGIETTSGILEAEAKKLNETYLKFIVHSFPFVTLKLAVTLDGKIAATDGSSQWITGPETKRYVHQFRAWSDAVMVGVGTVQADDPQLTVREVEGCNPLRVVVDSHLRLSGRERVFSDKNVVIATTNEAPTDKRAVFRNRKIDVWEFTSSNGLVPLDNILSLLGKRGVTSVLCEGGKRLATSLLQGKLVDKILFAYGPRILGSGLDAVGDLGIQNLAQAISLVDMEIETFGDNVVISGYPVYS